MSAASHGRRPRVNRKAPAALLALGLAAGCTPGGSGSGLHTATDTGGAGRTVALKFYDPQGHGTLLTPGRARAVTHGSGGSDSDALVDPRTLRVLDDFPLYEDGRRLRFDLPGRGGPAALALNWPTDQGFSTVVLDNGGKGFTHGTTVVFNHAAAKDAERRLDEALALRPAYRRSARFTAARRTAARELARADAADSDAGRGKHGQRALSAIDTAYGLLLEEYGPRARRTHAPWTGVTVADGADPKRWAPLAGRLTRPHGWARIVFDADDDPRAPVPRRYREAVAAAHAAGLKVLGQPVDSAYANGSEHPELGTRAGYLARIKRYVDAFPEIEAWEVGNEVNGCWTDSRTTADGDCTDKLLPPRDRMRHKIADAAAYVRKKRPGADVVLTLYWQLGTDAARWSAFTWPRANLPRAVREDIDVVLLSSWIEDAPLGLAFDQVMTRLAADFPGRRVGLGELGYWNADTSRFYWAFDEDDPAAARRRVARRYYAAALGYPSSVGGTFWWYFAQEMPGDAGLRAAVGGAVRDAR
ncbi:hypothetical protein C9F11_18940 [Streptomyces sp. YIM 121038]|uniref:hypothetical protein n=1 Tax=Streptomyces sp. YIM 121038 TaxID=2136401 RepID=UPI001110A8C6|nr:hypothetical protein [Streptomyces sp. YIM 121038]QCX77440.1 hypothetical protein C9F11_18940 [Streptomyces sp. YIM 121038]